MSQYSHDLHKPEHEGSRKLSARFIRVFLIAIITVMGCISGFGLGGLAIMASAHGGPGWPIAVICGPVALTLNLFDGGNVNDGLFILGGTALLYATYASLAVSKKTWRMVAALVAVHVISAATCMLFY
jgi:hypothetical protein